jgi:5-methylcytosine-specific restriction endonuclease McrA
VILLRRYVRIPNGRAVPVSRRGVLRRDAQRCAYCGSSASTIDHVIPRSRGGADSWENLVACCLRCNNVKGDRTPQEMGWPLRYVPRAPHGTAWLVRGVERTQPQWEEFLAPAA